MIVKLLTAHHLEFLSLKGGCRGSSKSTHVKMPHCWKSHVMAQMPIAILETCILHMSSEASCLHFGPDLYLQQHFVCLRRVGSAKL